MSTSQLYTHHSRPVGFSSPTPKHPLTSYVSCPYTNKTCVWSGKKLKRNAWFYKYTKETRILLFKYLMQLIPYIQINEYIVNDILDYILPKSYATPLFMYVDYESLLGNLIRNEVVQHAFNKTNLLVEPKTKSGRRIKAPDRFSNKEYLKGSGFSGCDHYDRGFAGKNHGDYGSKLWEKESKTSTYQKNDFIVDDDETEYCEINSSEEEECDYSETDESELDEDELYDDE